MIVTESGNIDLMEEYFVSLERASIAVKFAGMSSQNFTIFTSGRNDSYSWTMRVLNEDVVSSVMSGLHINLSGNNWDFSNTYFTPDRQFSTLPVNTTV
jgi:hypothetical protein